MSASYPPGHFIDLDLSDEGPDDYPHPLRPRHRARRIILPLLIVLVCLALGIGLGFLAGKGGDTGGDVPEPAAGAESPAPPTAAAASGLSQTEASRTVERRFAGVALERAEGIVGRGASAGQVAVGGGGQVVVAPSEPDEPGETALLEPLAPEERAAPNETDDAAVESALLPSSTEAAAEPSAVSGERAEPSERERERAREPRPDRWADPNVEPVDYDFSVPFEERESRMRDRLRRIDQEDPYED